MSLSIRSIRRSNSFPQLFQLHQRYRNRFRDDHWLATLSSFRRLAKKTDRMHVLAAGKELSERVSPFMRSASIETVGEVAFTYGQLGLRHSDVVAQCRRADLKGARVSDLTKCLWGPLLLGEERRNHQIRVAEAVEGLAVNEYEIPIEDCRRLHFCSLIGRVNWGDECLGTTTQKIVRQAISKFASHPTNPSRFQKEATANVRQIMPKSWVMHTEYYVEGFHLDIAFPEQKIAIEVDGPWHYYNDSDEVMTKDKVKDRVLEGLGWKVWHLSYLDT